MLIGTDGRLKLADCVLSAPIDPNGHQGQWGTKIYMALEVRKGSTFGIEADWFAVGAVLYDMFTQRPAITDTVDDVLYKDPMKYVDNGVPPLAKDLIARLLCKDSQSRFGHHGADQIKRYSFFASMD